MRRIWALLALVLVLSGCTADSDMDRALAFRQQLQGSGCSFAATVTADYGQRIQEFVLRCEMDRAGNLSFQVLAPEQIAGICGTVDGQGGRLTFEDQVLAFEPLAQGRLAPVTGPWLVIHSLRSGYLSSCGQRDGGMVLSLDDTYQEDALRLEVRVEEDVPVLAEIFWQGRRVLTLRIENFRYL